MNSFLDLHASADYRNTNRPYYTSTWEYINVASDYLIPFQFETEASDFTLYSVDTDGAETDITNYLNASQLITGWTETGTGSVSYTSAQINYWNYTPSSYIQTNTFSLTEGDTFYFSVDNTAYPDSDDMIVQLLKGAVQEWQEDLDELTSKRYTVITSGSDYSIRITNSAGQTDQATLNTPWAGVSSIDNSGDYYWYNGNQLGSTLPDSIFYLKLVTGSDTYYSDWCEACGFDDKTKISLSSEYDYGGIKYVGGYEQWMYKDATVRRSPKAEIEIVGDKLNGKIIEEKKTSAIRYKITMKCTESEYEGLVHAIGGDLEITDQTGKTYDAVNIEITDPTWYRANGVVELSFIDNNNINVFSRNNSTL